MVHFGLITFRFAYGRDRNSSFLWFRDFWKCPRAPKTTIVIFGDTWTPKIKKSLGHFQKYYVCKSQNFGNPLACRFLWEKTPLACRFLVGKDGRRQMSKIRLIKHWKSWIWDRYLSKNIKWKFGQSLKLWNQEAQTQGTKKPRNQERPSTYRLPPLPPTTIVGCWLSLRQFFCV